MYGFQKIIGKKNRDKGAYFHELFLRGRPGLSRGMLRLSHRALLDPDNEPNLCLYPPMPHYQLESAYLNVFNQPVNKINILCGTSFPRTVQYGITSNSSGDIKVIPDVPPMGDSFSNDHVDDNFSSTTSSQMVVQGTKEIDVTNAPLLQRIKIEQKEQTRVHSSCEQNNVCSSQANNVVR